MYGVYIWIINNKRQTVLYFRVLWCNCQQKKEDNFVWVHKIQNLFLKIWSSSVVAFSHFGFFNTSFSNCTFWRKIKTVKIVSLRNMPWHDAWPRQRNDKWSNNWIEKRFVSYRVVYCHKPFLFRSISCLKRPNINRKLNNCNLC